MTPPRDPLLAPARDALATPARDALATPARDALATPARDTQRSRVYAGEHLVHALFDRSDRAPVVRLAGSSVTLPVERRFGDIAGVQRYVDAVLALNWMRDYPRAAVPVGVRARRGRRQAHYERNGAVIAVPAPTHGAVRPGSMSGPTWALRELVVLHEIAHHLEPDPSAPAHGLAFVGRLRRIVEEIVGPEAAWLLTVAWADQGVRG